MEQKMVKFKQGGSGPNPDVKQKVFDRLMGNRGEDVLNNVEETRGILLVRSSCVIQVNKH